MRKLALLFVAHITFCEASAQYVTLPPSGDNQRSEVSQWIGPVKVTIVYNSPNVTAPDGQGRTGKIWGGAAHFGLAASPFGNKDMPWRAGANENTTITFSHDVNINDKPLKAGTYGFFVIVEKDKPWTLIFSNSSSDWGSFWYNSDEDALRVEATPADAPFLEWLTYGFDVKETNHTVAHLHWEKKRVTFKIEVPDINELYLGLIRADLRSSKGMIYYNWLWAAQFCAQHKINLEEALGWADRAASDPFFGSKNFETLSTKASILALLGKRSDADLVMQEALHLPVTTLLQIHDYAKGLLLENRKEKALEVFKLNRQLHPDDPFITYIGLARGFAAVGDKKSAIKNWESAIKGIPENQRQNLALYEAELKKLKE